MLASTLYIPLEETMAVGDASNDISMLRVAGLGVAMGQASRRVRASADVVTGSNAEDGLAQALETHVLGFLFNVNDLMIIRSAVCDVAPVNGKRTE